MSAGREQRGRRHVGHRLGDVVVLEVDVDGERGRQSVDRLVLHRRQRIAERQRHRQDAELPERLDLDRRAPGRADFLTLKVRHSADRLMGQHRRLTVGAGHQHFHALVGAERGQALPDLRVGQHPEGVLRVVEQAGRIEHLEARLQADEEAGRRAADLDRAERDTLHDSRNLAELVGRINVDLDAPARALLDAGLHRFEELVRDIVDGRERHLHRELLGTRSRCENSGRKAEECNAKPTDNRLHDCRSL